MNSLPKVKAFLKERGHVDSYPLVEVSWQRGHDPEVEFWNCDGRPPSKLKGEKPALTVALSPYETTELHSLLQCHGIFPANGSPAPRAQSIQEACQLVPEVSTWSIRWVLAAGTALCVTLMLLFRYCCGTAPKVKTKLDDSVDSTELGDAL